ncbi:hypothetical protein AVEN_28194-1 [Araneus ventricosus]|uniref:Mos1 transposase HTH domain-containing protein n=1 Tax=Araneus ventricosus TaxID=182803 RepID=A0A4Y2V783_ARAVE|nr:hypothetical protein AVEN_217317-1 [Araneus ventricosus]GBO31978.1 hypothetical protein AVEN_28194-1 [Araneus ventricosus]
MSSLEQSANIKFCVLLEKSPSETLEMLKKAYGNDAMKKAAVYEWHKGKLGTRQNDVGGFSITIALFTTDLILKAKLSIENFTWRPLNDYEMQSDENDLKNGQQTIGFFYTTMLHHIAL